MGRKAKEMGSVELRGLTEPGLHFVGGVDGLALHIAATGGRSWILRMMVAGRRRDMGLGGFPDVTLADARRRAREARDMVRQGVDPIDELRAKQSALRAAASAAMNFEECAGRYIEAHRAGWNNAKHVQQWQNTLATYAFPVIGRLLVRDIGLPHVLKVLEPIWTTKTETASRLRGRMESILDWAKGRGYRSGDNPAAWKGNLDSQLPRADRVAKVEHHPAVPVAEVGACMARIRAADGMGARALEFAILTAARSGEVRGATWAEIDLNAKVWTVPADRMKAKRDHRVPLSDAAMSILRRMAEEPRLAGSELVFPAARGGTLSDMTLSAVMRRLEIDAVPHGFRSTFRDWAAETTRYPREVAEMALAHTIGDKVEAAYRRGDLFDKRRRMMNDWAGFVGNVGMSGEVIALRASQA